MVISFACLAYAFLNDDFSVNYVARNSNSLLPDRYKFAAVWGGHEGSLLLWVLILASWSYAVSLFSKKFTAGYISSSFIGDGDYSCRLFVIYVTNVKSL